MTHRLHLAPSNSAAGATKMALPDQEVAAFPDSLTDGPVVPFGDTTGVRPWLVDRIDFWERLSPRLDRDRGIKSIDRFTDLLERFDEYDEVVVWTSEELGEGLFACWVVAAAAEAGFDLSRLLICCPPETEGASMPVSFATTGPERHREATPRPWTDAELEAARTVWQAYTASTPEPLLQFLNESTDLLFLSHMSAILDRYPSHKTGLDRWETWLLDRLSKHTEVTARTIGEILGVGWEETYEGISDRILFDRLRESSNPEADDNLLRRWGPGTSMVNTFFGMTELGEAVLAGECNRIEVMGLDRWVGGVHLDSATGQIWCREGETVEAVSFPDAPAPPSRPVLTPPIVREAYPSDEIDVAVGNGYRTVASAVPDRRVWRLPRAVEEQPGPIRSLADWISQGEAADLRGAEPSDFPNVAWNEGDPGEFREALRAASEVNFWIADSVEEWLLVGAIAAELQSTGSDPAETLKICEVEETGARDGVSSVHPLVLEETPCRRSADLVDELSDVWEALTAPTPERLNEVRQSGLSHEPASEVVDLIFDQFPNSSSGLTPIERDILERVDEDRRMPSADHDDTRRRLADSSFEKPPLREMMAGRHFELTNFGRRLLDGQANHVRTNGIDRWIGGIHLSSEEGNMWWREERRLVPDDDVSS